MSYTVFRTPGLSYAMHIVARVVLKIMGWRVQNNEATPRKCVMVAAPHTSNWDLPYTLLLGFALRIRANWMGKKALFRKPFSLFFKYLGGIPVDRSSSHNVVDQMIEVFRSCEEFILIISPEGTRSKVSAWKSGFYHISLGAQVPLILGFIDYTRKIGGIGPIFQYSGDYEQDMMKIKEFYAPIRGKVRKNI
ncbi:lysophospholipid acyltransferase family protein [candidate division CSSED10-310 bacterium]|uniref:Lysophospholipid acyltransferase family protein n=1 Tax=candidate division CSSED10-310 bacterium TaxID=2855610 RepID=A0ABV6Z1P3_UNCC1